MPRKPFESVLRDVEVMTEFRRRAGSRNVRSRAGRFNVSPESVRELTESAPDTAPPEAFTEAIILDFARPALLVQNNSFEEPQSEVWQNRLQPTRTHIERSIRSVGRVEVIGHPTHEWIGTAWMVTDQIAVTNRHVANEFAQRRNGAFVFLSDPLGGPMKVLVDFKEEYIADIDGDGQNEMEIAVAEVVFVEELGSDFPDLALVKLKAAHGALPSPINLKTERPQNSMVAVIGYPARDSRNAASSLDQVFGDIYNVKRLAPGMIDYFDHQMVFTHDCSTLGGNSGSAVIDIEDGCAVGLHFGGRFRVANYAVKAKVIEDRLNALHVSAPVPGLAEPIEVEVEKRELSDYDSREGYQETFLGDTFSVALPAFGPELLAQLAEVEGGGHQLKYTHFNVVINKERRLAMYTACNIDGLDLRRFPRGRDKWYIDPRLPKEHQADNFLYRGNDLDRGHLVRRLDPVWGTKETAEVAQDDTFHYTNAAPQHKDLNRKIWLDLEDHILDNVEIHDLKVSVFCGPVFQVDDQMHRGVKIPREFWKIIALVKEDGQKLSATAYLLSQKDMITDLEEFVFGQFRTYQVNIGLIEEKTGLDFGDLKDHDPFVEEAIRGRELADVSRIVV